MGSTVRTPPDGDDADPAVAVAPQLEQLVARAVAPGGQVDLDERVVGEQLDDRPRRRTTGGAVDEVDRHRAPGAERVHHPRAHGVSGLIARSAATASAKAATACDTSSSVVVWRSVNSTAEWVQGGSSPIASSAGAA